MELQKNLQNRYETHAQLQDDELERA